MKQDWFTIIMHGAGALCVVSVAIYSVEKVPIYLSVSDSVSSSVNNIIYTSTALPLNITLTWLYIKCICTCTWGLYAWPDSIRCACSLLLSHQSVSEGTGVSSHCSKSQSLCDTHLSIGRSVQAGATHSYVYEDEGIITLWLFHTLL